MAKSPTMMSDLGKDLGFTNMCRSGSAPPTVEGSLNAVEGEMRADPAYLSYYYSNVNLNPRLPPPVLSKEEWRSTQRLGGIGDRRRSEIERKEEENEWVSGGGDGLIGLKLGKQKNLAEIFQDGTGQTTSAPDCSSRPASCNAFDCDDTKYSSETRLALHHEIASAGGKRPDRNAQTVVGLQNKASQTFASVLISSLSRNTTPDAQQVPKAPSPSLPNVGVQLSVETNKIDRSAHASNGAKSDVVKSEDLLAASSGTNHSSSTSAISSSKRYQEIDAKQGSGQNCVKPFAFSKHLDPGHSSVSSIPNSVKSSHLVSKANIDLADFTNLAFGSNPQLEPHRQTYSSNSYLKAPSVASPVRARACCQKADSTYATATSYGLSGYSINPALPPLLANHIGTGNLPPLFENAAAAASAIAALGMDSRVLGNGFSSGGSLNGNGFSSGGIFNGSTELPSPNRIGNLPMNLVDPQHIQYLKMAEYAAQGAANISDPSMDRGYISSSYLDLLGMHDAYLGNLLHQKQYGAPYLSKSGPSSPAYYGSPTFGRNMSYPGSPSASPIPASQVGSDSPVRLTERSLRFHPGLSNFAGGIMGSWNPGLNGNLDKGFPSTLLEEFKSNNTRCFELSDIAGHVVEFSADQFGSRFIQQKLETATPEAKDMIFEEITLQALSLMTDVFGNYVIQKFFDRGSATQIRELANQLNGHVLTLSLQMYGCRVIQKAIEVVSFDQQTKMVAELDGHVLRCVRDQNGNHVIQKCIECIPQAAIQFIISSFYDHVVTLSTHPYGCRVIQRVLEHCDDPKTQQIFVDEIMQNVCMLAQDQYGNYVVQHVLEHGKPHERSTIIKQLAGQIVQMSQQKFASNVVEKCLTFGGHVERQILIKEMLGSTEENEPLQAMMKDQFANYVVQKVLETCDDQQRELILSRVKVHLNALKKYTYGKHIVARVEKLVAAGERRLGLRSSYPSYMA